MSHAWAFIVPMLALSIPIIAILSKVATRWIEMKERQTQAIGQGAAEKAAQYAAHTERLEQRVRVLERIITDKGLGVADEIDRLRDDRAN
jgi:hypothetical protein